MRILLSEGASTSARQAITVLGLNGYDIEVCDHRKDLQAAIHELERNSAFAELGAAFLAAEFSFDGDVRHAGYIATWISLLRNDKRAFFTAASKAQAAADYLRGLVLAESIARAA